MADVIRKDVVEIGFNITDDPFEHITKEINNLKKALGMVDTDDAFDDLKDDVEKTKKPLKDTEENVKKVKDRLGDVAKKGQPAYNALKKVASVSFKALTVGLAGATAGVVAISKASISAYADYEQLVGGVDTLFKDASGTVQKNAAKAFETAGLSANQYMETVTSFSASLINSVGGDTKKAADMSDMAIKDMSDNANKMGTDMEVIMGTYQSLAKGNFAIKYSRAA